MGCLKLHTETTPITMKVVWKSSVVGSASAQCFMSVDPLAGKYPNMSPYNYCAGNPVKYLDPDRRYIDVSGLYKGGFGIIKNQNNIKGFEAFASSSDGIKYLSLFAEEGQVIAGHTYTENGIYHNKGINVHFEDETSIEDMSRSGETQISNGGYDLYVRADKKSNIFSAIKTYGHEFFTHVLQTAQDLYDDNKLNSSNINPALINNNAPLDLKTYNGQTEYSKRQHLQERNYNRSLETRLLPILRENVINNLMNLNGKELLDAFG